VRPRIHSANCSKCVACRIPAAARSRVRPGGCKQSALLKQANQATTRQPLRTNGSRIESLRPSASANPSSNIARERMRPYVCWGSRIGGPESSIGGLSRRMPLRPQIESTTQEHEVGTKAGGKYAGPSSCGACSTACHGSTTTPSKRLEDPPSMNGIIEFF